MSIITTYYESDLAFANLLSTLFDGDNERGDMGKTIPLEFTGSFGISVWVKFTNISKNEFLIDTCTHTGNGDGYQLRLTTTNKIRWWSYKAIAGQFVDSTTTIVAGTWYNFIGVRDFAAKRNKLYVNGLLEATSTVDIDLTTSDTTNLRVAFSFIFNGLNLDGNMDEVTWWNTLLDDTDASNLYNGGTPNNPNLHAKATFLTEYHKMGDGSIFPIVTGEKGVRDITLVNMEASDFVADTPP